MKNLMNLGKTLNKKEQKAINGGGGCDSQFAGCVGGCSGMYNYLGLYQMASCYAVCRGKEAFCNLNEALTFAP